MFMNADVWKFYANFEFNAVLVICLLYPFLTALYRSHTDENTD